MNHLYLKQQHQAMKQLLEQHKLQLNVVFKHITHTQVIADNLKIGLSGGHTYFLVADNAVLLEVQRLTMGICNHG